MHALWEGIEGKDSEMRQVPTRLKGEGTQERDCPSAVGEEK